MDEEKFNTSVRQFLKQVGINSQREIEKAVWSQIESKKLKGNEQLQASMHLEIPALGLSLDINDIIVLDD
jgi:hypothetical protein